MHEVTTAFERVNCCTRLSVTEIFYVIVLLHSGGPGSVVGIATGYGRDGPGIESRQGTRFSAPVQTVPGAHTASCTMGAGSFPGVKSGRGVTLTPYPLLVLLVMREQSYTSTPPMGRMACTEPQCLYKGALYLFPETKVKLILNIQFTKSGGFNLFNLFTYLICLIYSTYLIYLIYLTYLIYLIYFTYFIYITFILLI